MKINDIKKEIKERTQKYASLKKADVFIFGSSVRAKHFHDIDVGIIGGKSDDISLLKEDFEESQFPYTVDIVDFSDVDDSFRKKVFNTPMVWITEKKK